MNTLISVLLYIGAITTNIEYTESEIIQIEGQNQSTVDLIESNPRQLDKAINYSDELKIEILTGDKFIVTGNIEW